MTETRTAPPKKAKSTRATAADSAPERKRSKSTKGEQSRKLLLDAALVSIAKQGIHSVTHRSIAAEAGVPKSLTTYFFSSLPDLLEQAFIHFTTLAAQDNVLHLKELDALVARHTANWPMSDSARRTLHRLLSQRLTDFIVQQASEHSVGVAVELNFLYIYRADPPIRRHIEAYRDMLLKGLESLVHRFSQAHAMTDASLMLGMIHQLLFKATLTPRQIDRERVHAEVSRLMSFIFL